MQAPTARLWPAFLRRSLAAAGSLDLKDSEIVQLERLRTGIWGTAGLWGRVVTYKDYYLAAKLINLSHRR